MTSVYRDCGYYLCHSFQSILKNMESFELNLFQINVINENKSLILDLSVDNFSYERILSESDLKISIKKRANRSLELVVCLKI